MSDSAEGTGGPPAELAGVENAGQDRPTENLDFVPLPSEFAFDERQPCLIAVAGPEKGATFALPQGETVLGRSAQPGGMVLTGPGLSRAHARVRVSGERVEVEDLGSTNGTFVNGEPVTTYLLSPGDTLGLGPQIQLRLEFPQRQVQELLQEVYRGATLDGLTGLLNRRSFLQRLAEEHAAARRHGMDSSVVMVDVDHFKSVNDTHGHPAGDAVLLELARRFAAAVRTEDVVGRYGGEEFVLLLRHAPTEGGVTMMERLRQRIVAEPFPAGDLELPITFSAGVARLDPDCPPEESVARADRALYQAKRGGRNRVCSE